MAHEIDTYCHYSDLPSPMAYAVVETTEETGDPDTDRIIEMAWEDRTPFDAIKAQFGLNEQSCKRADEERTALQQLPTVAKTC